MKKSFSVLLGMAFLVSCHKNKDPKPENLATVVEIKSNELNFSMSSEVNIEDMVIPDYFYELQTNYQNIEGLEYFESSSAVVMGFPLLAPLDLSEAKYNDKDMLEYSKGIFFWFSPTIIHPSPINYTIKAKDNSYWYSVNVQMSLPDTFSVKVMPTT